MQSRKISSLAALLGVVLTPLVPCTFAQDNHRGRKYKPPPDTAHIEVEVLRGTNAKPISNAAVVFNVERDDGKDEGNLEIKTGPDGKAAIDVIPIGSKIRVQVISDGFATFAEEYMIPTDKKEISIKMVRPRAQISTYVDNSDKPADRKPGVQEPIRSKPVTPPPPAAPPPTGTSTAPAADPNAPAAKPNF